VTSQNPHACGTRSSHHSATRLIASPKSAGPDSLQADPGPFLFGIDYAATADPSCNPVAEMETESTLKKVEGFAFGAVVLLGIVLLIGFLVGGMLWVSEKALPWLIVGGNIAFVLCVFVFLPLAIFRRARPWAGLGLYASSYVFGIGLFAYSCIYAVRLWGYGALFIGLFLAGVGVVPVAFLATLFHKAWPLFWDVVYGVVMTYGTRSLGARFADTPAPKEEAIHEFLMRDETDGERNSN